MWTPKATPVTMLAADAENNDVGLALKRCFLTFDASDTSGFIHVVYEEYYQSPTGHKLDLKVKTYVVQKDKFEVWDVTVIPGGMTIGNYIRAAINNTLTNLVPLEAENGYVIP